MKLGQLISLQGEDLLPPELAEILSTLRNQAHEMPEAQVRDVLEVELGVDWEERFAEFDFEPLAAASIGQVHAAETRDGRDLALKLQYPGVAESISSDVDNLSVLVRVTRLLPPEINDAELLAELKRELEREADYAREAASTERYAELVRDDPAVLVPRVHHDLSSSRLLATDRIYALPIEELRSPEYATELRDEMGGHLLRIVFRELFAFGFMQTDPNFANYLYEPKERRIALLDFGASREFEPGFVERYRQLIAAIVDGERSDVLDAGRRLGFLVGDEGEEARDAFLEFTELFSEPLRMRGRYDFAASDLSQRVRDRGLRALTRHQLPRPPTDTLFLHRKLAGSFLLCAHIHARVDCGALYREFVLGTSGA
jgi:predicted unusual protein kinase regulating ubiquinone biosynthesis (AarF/ABC1/UbiB family)